MRILTNRMTFETINAYGKGANPLFDIFTLDIGVGRSSGTFYFSVAILGLGFDLRIRRTSK